MYITANSYPYNICHKMFNKMLLLVYIIILNSALQHNRQYHSIILHNKVILYPRKTINNRVVNDSSSKEYVGCGNVYFYNYYKVLSSHLCFGWYCQHSFHSKTSQKSFQKSPFSPPLPYPQILHKEASGVLTWKV